MGKILPGYAGSFMILLASSRRTENVGNHPAGKRVSGETARNP